MSQVNLVELMWGDEPGSGFNQRCKYGYLVAGHSVYCHNDEWENSPRKCRRSWYYGGTEPEYTDENCPGYKPNPEYQP